MHFIELIAYFFGVHLRRHSIQKLLDACTTYISDPLNAEILTKLRGPSLSLEALTALFSHEKLAVPEIELFEVIHGRVSDQFAGISSAMNAGDQKVIKLVCS